MLAILESAATRPWGMSALWSSREYLIKRRESKRRRKQRNQPVHEIGAASTSLSSCFTRDILSLVHHRAFNGNTLRS
jgi:hypothetical protein